VEELKMATEYSPADEVKDIAENLAKYHEHLSGRFDEIAFLFQAKEIRSRTKVKWFSIRPTSGPDRYLHSMKFTVSIYEDSWNQLTDAQKETLVDEVLSTIKPSEKGDLGLVAPDASLYIEVLSRHSNLLPQAAEVVEVLRVKNRRDAE